MVEKALVVALQNLCAYGPDSTGQYCISDLEALQYEGRAALAQAEEVGFGSVETLQQEVEEQARLNGMGAEREARLLAQVEELTRELEAVKQYARNLHGAAVGVSFAAENGLSVPLGIAAMNQVTQNVDPRLLAE